MKKSSLLLRVALVAALLAAAAWTVDPVRLWQCLTLAMVWALPPTLVACLAGSIPIAVRLSILAGKPGFLVSWKAFFLSAAINSFFPGRVGELVKPIFLNEHAGIPLSQGFAALFLERVIDVAILFGLALGVAGMSLINLDWKFAAAVFAGLLGVVCALPLLESRLTRLIRFIPFEKARVFCVDALAHAAQSIRGGVFLRAFALGIASWTLQVAAVYVFFRLACPVPISAKTALIFFVVTTFSYLIPFLPAGIGAFEAGAVFVLQYHNVSVEEALALGIIFHAATIFFSLAGGTTVMLHDHIGLTEFLRRLKSGWRGERHSV